MPKNPEAAPAWLEHSERIGFLLKSLHHTLRQTIDQALREQGVELSFAHLAALFNLHHEPGISGAQLARRAMVSAQTMNAALRTLEREGYIERRAHPDSRRADSWSLTAAGLRELGRAREVGTAVFGKMLGALDAREVAALENYLGRCVAALDTGAGPENAALRAAAEAPSAARRQASAARGS